MDDLVPPVVTTKPTRGREMQTTTIPTDMFDTMRMMSAKKTLGGEDVTPELQKPTDGNAEYYHEGYVDGKMYLVPDSNLEAMKDIINFKMRPRRSTRYKHQTSYEISDYDHFRGKLDGLFGKLDNIQDLHSITSDENNNEPEVAWKPEGTLRKELDRRSEESEEKYKDQDLDYKYEDQDSKYDSEAQDSEYDSEDEDSEDEESEDKPKEWESKEELKPKAVKFEEEESDVHYLRFLVSGHLKKDQNPIYIIQEYNGEPDLFKNQKADFVSKQKDGDVDVFISGKFYNENMLEEAYGKPIALMTKPDKIKIEMRKSKIYYDYFKDIYNMKNVDILFKGEFIKSKVTNRITPFFTLCIERRTPNQKPLKEDARTDQNVYNKNVPPTTILFYKPKYDANPFSGDVEYINNRVIEGSSTKNYLHPKPINEALTDTKLSENDNSSEQVFTHLFPSSCMGEDFLGDGNVNGPINIQFNHPFQSSSIQSDIFYPLKEPGEAVPVSGETFNTRNNNNQTKRSLREGFLIKFLKESSAFKSLFEKNRSKHCYEMNIKTEKSDVSRQESTKNTQETPENNLLETKNENIHKTKIKSIFNIFK